MLLRRFDEAIAPLKEGLRRNEDVPYGLNALGHLAKDGKAVARLFSDFRAFCWLLD